MRRVAATQEGQQKLQPAHWLVAESNLPQTAVDHDILLDGHAD